MSRCRAPADALGCPLASHKPLLSSDHLPCSLCNFHCLGCALLSQEAALLFTFAPFTLCDRLRAQASVLQVPLPAPPSPKRQRLDPQQQPRDGSEEPEQPRTAEDDLFIDDAGVEAADYQAHHLLPLTRMLSCFRPIATDESC